MHHFLQLEILQRQVSTLADSQSNAEDRTSRTKTENAVLQARYHMLEDQLREVCTDFLFQMYIHELRELPICDAQKTFST